MSTKGPAAMSWEQYLSIAREAAQIRQEEMSRPPAACPNDGEPLTAGGDGSLFCRFDGYRWPDDASTFDN